MIGPPETGVAVPVLNQVSTAVANELAKTCTFWWSKDAANIAYRFNVAIGGTDMKPTIPGARASAKSTKAKWNSNWPFCREGLAWASLAAKAACAALIVTLGGMIGEM